MGPGLDLGHFGSLLNMKWPAGFGTLWGFFVVTGPGYGPFLAYLNGTGPGFGPFWVFLLLCKCCVTVI